MGKEREEEDCAFCMLCVCLSGVQLLLLGGGVIEKPLSVLS